MVDAVVGAALHTTPGTCAETLDRSYVDAVARAGGLPVLLPVLDPEDALDVLEGLDGLLLTGGPDIDPARYGAVAAPEVYGIDPSRDGWELALARHATIPMLGICRGTQVLNVARGGSLVQHLPAGTTVEHRAKDRPGRTVHRVRVERGSQLHQALGTARVRANSLHHQAVAEVGTGLRVVGVGDDGVVEAIEATSGAVLGVQWHPELLAGQDPHGRLFDWLVLQAADRRRDLAGV